MNNIKIGKTIKRVKRVGRGPASGKGKTSGRGMNGQRSRTGARTTQIEGGQTKLIMRLPKAGGFKSIGRNKTIVLTTDKLNKLFPSGGVVTADKIIDAIGEKSAKNKKIKIIKGSANLSAKISVSEEVKTSKSINKKSEAASSKEGGEEKTK